MASISGPLERMVLVHCNSCILVELQSTNKVISLLPIHTIIEYKYLRLNLCNGVLMCTIINVHQYNTNKQYKYWCKYDHLRYHQYYHWCQSNWWLNCSTIYFDFITTIWLWFVSYVLHYSIIQSSTTSNTVQILGELDIPTIIKNRQKENKKIMEDAGIDPATSRMLSERSTIWANPPVFRISSNQPNTYPDLCSTKAIGGH